MRLALFQPDIPQNLGGAIRLAACLGLELEVIEPCAFPLGDRAMKRAALDYGPLAKAIRHDGWSQFLAHPARQEGRLILFTTRASQTFHGFAYAPGDTLLFGQESSGAPEHVHEAAQARLVIPIRPEARSFNLVTACAIAAAEALRQVNGFPLPRG
jgi:tRNA (cytidine/uridine-2'-O-)-methyltransferase